MRVASSGVDRRAAPQPHRPPRPLLVPLVHLLHRALWAHGRGCIPHSHHEPTPASIAHRPSPSPPADDKFQADVFAYDDALKAVVFRRQPQHTFQKADYRVVPVAAIKAASDLGRTPDNVPAVRETGPAEGARRVEDAVRKHAEQKATRGVGVTAEAQFVFDFVHKQ